MSRIIIIFNPVLISPGRIYNEEEEEKIARIKSCQTNAYIQHKQINKYLKNLRKENKFYKSTFYVIIHRTKKEVKLIFLAGDPTTFGNLLAARETIEAVKDGNNLPHRLLRFIITTIISSFVCSY